MGSAITAQGLAANQSLGGEKIVWSIVCFAYSLLSLLLLVVVLVVVLALVFPLLSYKLSFISTHEFPLLSIWPPHPAGGKGRGD